MLTQSPKTYNTYFKRKCIHLLLKRVFFPPIFLTKHLQSLTSHPGVVSLSVSSAQQQACPPSPLLPLLFCLSTLRNRGLHIPFLFIKQNKHQKPSNEQCREHLISWEPLINALPNSAILGWEGPLANHFGGPCLILVIWCFKCISVFVGSYIVTRGWRDRIMARDTCRSIFHSVHEKLLLSVQTPSPPVQVQESLIHILYCHMHHSWLIFYHPLGGKGGNTIVLHNIMAFQNLFVLKIM